MTKHTFIAEPRVLSGRKNNRLRTAGVVPANIFSSNQPSRNIQLSGKDFLKLVKQVGESSLLYLQVKGSSDELPVLVRDLVVHPVTGSLQHVVFQQVNLKEKTSATIPLVLQGEPAAETQKLGIMVQQLDEVEVEALPTDIPENIILDVTGLAEVGSSLQIKDLHLDTAKFTLITDLESVIVQIVPLAKEEAAPAPVASPGEIPETPAPEVGAEPAAAAPAPEK